MRSTETVRMALPPAITEVGLSEAVTPAGAPLTERLTVFVTPEVSAVLIVDVPDAPWFTLRAAGLALIEKSLGATVRVVMQLLATLLNCCWRV